MIPLRIGSVLFVALWVSCSANGNGDPDSDSDGGGGGGGAGGENVGGQQMSSGGAGGLPKGAGGAAGGFAGAGGKTLSDAGVGADAPMSQGGVAGAPAPNTVIDTHTHFWDPSRANPPDRSKPIPWPGPDLPELYRPILPAEYAMKTKDTGITATIVVEASGWLEDNDWVLALAKTSPIIVGVVGSFGEVMNTNKFDAALMKYSNEPLFRGIRVGGGDITAALSSPGRLAEFTKLADADLAVDVLGASVADVIKIAVAVPKLRVIVDHMAGVNALDPSSGWKKDIEALAKSAGAKRVYLKLSGLVESSGKPAPVDPARYQNALEHVWMQLGEDQLLYSTNWPVSELNAPLATVAGIMNAFLQTKPKAARDKVFWKNSQAAYKWQPRQ